MQPALHLADTEATAGRFAQLMRQPAVDSVTGTFLRARKPLALNQQARSVKRSGQSCHTQASQNQNTERFQEA